MEQTIGKMNEDAFFNVTLILANMDDKCKDIMLKPAARQGMFIEICSTDGIKSYGQVCIDDLYYNYSSGRMETADVADEAARRVTAKMNESISHMPAMSKETTSFIDIETDRIMDILRQLVYDAEKDEMEGMSSLKNKKQKSNCELSCDERDETGGRDAISKVTPPPASGLTPTTSGHEDFSLSLDDEEEETQSKERNAAAENETRPAASVFDLDDEDEEEKASKHNCEEKTKKSSESAMGLSDIVAAAMDTPEDGNSDEDNGYGIFDL